MCDCLLKGCGLCQPPSCPFWEEAGGVFCHVRPGVIVLYSYEPDMTAHLYAASIQRGSNAVDLRSISGLYAHFSRLFSISLTVNNPPGARGIF